MSFSIIKTGKRDAVADAIEGGDHDAPGDQSQLDFARQYIGAEVRRAATPDHDVYVAVSGHHGDQGIDPERQYRHLTIEIRASPDPTRTSGALGLDNAKFNVPGLTTETIRAAETVRTNTPHLADGPDPSTKVAGGPRHETGAETAAITPAAGPPPDQRSPGEKVVEAPPVSGVSAPALVELATREQAQGQAKTQDMLIEQQPKEEEAANDNTEVKTDGTETSPADEAHTAGQDHLVGSSEGATPAETVKEETVKEETVKEETVEEETVEDHQEGDV